MPKILKTSGQEIDQALRNVTRQYLVGDLQKPQALQHVPSSLIEIGITRYENEGKLEPPHRHKQSFEFQYMTAGLTAYLDLTTAEEHVFRKGDFCDRAGRCLCSKIGARHRDPVYQSAARKR